MTDRGAKCRAMLQELQKKSGNKKCADCGAKQPTWASTNIGVFVCIRCSGIHRSIGTHISKVKSATLDIWRPELVKHFSEQGGNEVVNSVYEAKLKQSNKPGPSSDIHRIKRFIEDKYSRKMWYKKGGKTKKGKKKRKRKKSDSSDSTDDEDSDSDSSSSDDSTSQTKSSPSEKKRKKKKAAKVKKVVKPKKSSKGKTKPKKLAAPATTTRAPEPAQEHLLDLGALKIENAPKRTGFDSSSFVDDLLSGPAASAPAEQKQADPFAGSTFASAAPASAKSNQTAGDILSMFSQPAKAQAPPPMMSMAAAPAQSGFPMMGQAPQRTFPTMMSQPAFPAQSAFPAQAAFPMQAQPRMAQQPMGFSNFDASPQPAMASSPQGGGGNFMTQVNRAPQAQARYMGQQPARPAFMGRPQPASRPAAPNLFSNPPLQTDAFSSLMMGSKPKLDNQQYPSAQNPQYKAKKNANDGLKIDFGGWMSK